MAFFKKLLFSLLLCFSICHAGAQVPQWVTDIGSSGNDDARACVVAPNGNVYLAGIFSGTVDLDPSASIHTVTSNGNTDIFLACYTSSGAYLWGLSIGGPNDDGALNLAVDKNSNAIIVGYFSGQHINFDPLSSGKYLSDQGVANGPIPTGGDGFAAKYDSTGACTWAIDLGGSSVFDLTEGVATDEVGNVYVGGDFHFTMDIDPGPGVTTLNALNGTGYLIKYTPAGRLAWGFSFGGPGNNGVDNAVWNIRAEGGYVYTVGTFQATGDFDPSAGTAILTASGTYDGYLAKYDTSGNYQFVAQVGGTGNEAVYGLATDLSNVYITGSSTSPAMFFSGAAPGGLTSPGGGTNSDMFLAKYTKAGAYVWAEMIGGPHDEDGTALAIKNNVLYTTGYFQDTVDFDPSPATAYLVSNGKNDIYLCKYDLDGNYICGFNVGSTGNDQGRSIAFDSLGYMYTCGQFTGLKTNFSPGPIPAYLSTQGAEDGYLVKYNWQGLPVAPTGYLVADTICSGSPGILTFIATKGTAPYTIVITDGQVADTLYNISSHQSIYLPIAPVVTTTYRLVLILSSGNCDPPGYVDTSAIILVNPLPVITVNNDTSVCPGTVVNLHITPGYTYAWYGTGIDSPSIADPHLVATTTTVCTVMATGANGCVKTASVSINVYGTDFTADVLNKKVCVGDTAQLNAKGGDTYYWYPDTDSTLSSDTSANPRAWPKQNTTYKVAVIEQKCGIKDTLSVYVMVHTQPIVRITEVHDVDCGNKAGLLVVTGAQSYQWSPDIDISDATSATPTVYPKENTTYYVIGTTELGCTSTDSATVQVFYDGTGRLFAPTAFTPNGDGKNDCFRIHIPGNVTNYLFTVFNRWGQIVYSSSTYGDCWDGSFNGVQQDMGSYFYSYKCISSSCGELKGKGDVQLIR